MRLIVTRPDEDAKPLAAKLEAMGHHAVLAPLLRIVARIDTVIPERDYQAVAITSASGARALKAHPARWRILSVPALTLGPQSLAAARSAGFANAERAGSDVAGMANWIATTRSPGDGPILYVSGADTAGDLQALLNARGFAVERAVLYDAVAVEGLAIDPDGADGVLLFSPRTARIWARLAARKAARLMHFCLSRSVAQALAETWPSRVAERPDETAMLTLLDRR